MNRVWVTAMLALTLGLSAQAQEKEKELPALKYGGKIGFNQSIITGAEDTTGKSGFHIGAVLEVFVSERISIQPELVYSTQGAKLEGVFPYSYSGKVKMNYINIPVMAKFFVSRGFNIQVGPQIGFAVKTDMELEGQTADIGSVVNKVDFGFNFGLGYNFPSGVFLETRYNVGTTNVLKNVDKSNKNGTFQFSLGYKFN
ncbi:porin family protein [Myroides injenensis]|uniref:porin family protein n=1 Tax=Myroides injenensis TaxID=1183151 RepID=UPI0002894C23|nr:porin family protein [Myroides injenensis]